MAQQKNYELFQFVSLCDKPQPELALDFLVVHVPQIAVATRFQMVARLLLGWQLSVECSSSLPTIDSIQKNLKLQVWVEVLDKNTRTFPRLVLQRWP